MTRLHRWSAAYYASGYTVECGLKACIPARPAATPEVIFEERRFSEKYWTHSAEELVTLADLGTTPAADMAVNPTLRANWLIVSDWSETSRYDTTSHWEAKKLYSAITDTTNGVMP